MKWTIWTPMFTVPKKAVKLNHSLTYAMPLPDVIRKMIWTRNRFHLKLFFFQFQTTLKWDGKPVKEESKRTYYNAVLLNGEKVREDWWLMNIIAAARLLPITCKCRVQHWPWPNGPGPVTFLSGPFNGKKVWYGILRKVMQNSVQDCLTKILTCKSCTYPNIQMWRKPHIFGSKKNNWVMKSKMVFKICEGISCSSLHVEEFDVIVHKKYIPCITLFIFYHSLPQITSKPGGWGGN